MNKFRYYPSVGSFYDEKLINRNIPKKKKILLYYT